MQYPWYFQNLRIRNLLSFGPEGVDISLAPLNILIGPNTSGKSNLLETIRMLYSAPNDIVNHVAHRGGVTNWFWKGCDPTQNPEIVIIVGPHGSHKVKFYYRLLISGNDVTTLKILEESFHVRLEDKGNTKGFALYEFSNGKAFITPTHFSDQQPKEPSEQLPYEPREVKDFNPSQSVFSQIRDPGLYPWLTMMGVHFMSMALYRDWPVGPTSPLRQLQRTDISGDTLFPDGSNLSIVLSHLQSFPDSWGRLIERAKEFYPDLDYISTRIQLGYVELLIHQKGLKQPIPAARLSDGTLRFLCLLAILCHPEPPPLVCIEEPELGLHPDMLPKVAEMLVEASERTQLIVTTHSDILVSALSDYPEYIIVCERDEEGTHLRRLEPEPLKKWLEDYSLGELWIKGELGGTRW